MAEFVVVAPSVSAPRWLRFYAAPAVLVLVACLQVVRAHTADQSSWSGGGFGMFATYENEDSRFLRVWFLTDDGERRTSLPAGLGRQALEARVLPTSGRLEALADTVADRADDPSVRGARVELWGVDFDPDSGELRAFRIEQGTSQR